MATAGAPVPLSPGDLDSLTVDVGPAPGNLEVVLELPDAAPDQAPRIAAVLAERIRAVPALRRAIHRDRRRLYWVEQPPRLEQHVRILDVRGEDSLVHASHLLTTHLDLATPPWRMQGLVGEKGVSVAFVAHHVLTDGLHGLAMLTSLADASGEQGTSAADTASIRQSRPSNGAGLGGKPSDRTRHRLPHLAPRTSLNRPTGADRFITTYDIALQALSCAAHRAGVTINDLLLVAISEAVAGELRRRGEYPRELRVWVPVAASARPADPASGQGGNAVGVMLVPVDVRAAVPDRLAQVSEFTTRRTPGARRPANLRAAHLISQASGRLGLARFMNQHQRIGNTSLSTMRGSATRLRLAGLPIRRIVPAASRAANVGVSFIALSYAGTLTISIVHDPAQLGDPAPLRADLAAALEGLGV